MTPPRTAYLTGFLAAALLPAGLVLCVRHLQPPPALPVPGGAPRVSQYFTPQDDLEQVWVERIRSSRRWVHIACFGLSNEAIASALTDAAHRGVEVIVVEDRRQSALPADRRQELLNAGCQVVVKHSHVLLHDKLGVFDGACAIVGSYNLSESAEAQDNSAVVFDHDPPHAAQDEAAWERLYAREAGHAYSPR